MPVDDTLPPSRLTALAGPEQILHHFSRAFGVRVDINGLDTLPALDRQRLAGARPLEPPEAVLLDRVLQLIPPYLLALVKRILVLPTRGTGRPGGYLNGIVRVSASEAEVRRPDTNYGSRFSVFTTTVVHEIGHAIYETVLTPDEQYGVFSSYLESPQALLQPDKDPSDQDVQHHFITLLTPALLGFGQLPFSAAASRRALASLGMVVRYL